MTLPRVSGLVHSAMALVVPVMVKQGQGVIVGLSSGAALMPSP